jgi:hypothetical protein
LNNLPSKEKFLEDLEENDDAESNDDELLFWKLAQKGN